MRETVFRGFLERYWFTFLTSSAFGCSFTYSSNFLRKQTRSKAHSKSCQAWTFKGFQGQGDNLGRKLLGWDSDMCWADIGQRRLGKGAILGKGSEKMLSAGEEWSEQQAFLADSARLKVQEGLYGDFPGSPVVKYLPCNTGMDAGSIPVGRGTKIPHAAEHLRPCIAPEEVNN